MSAHDEDKRAIAEALREHDSADARRAIADAVGVSSSQVSRWYRGLDRMTPRQVFATEDALGLEPGALSTVAGFAPVGATPSVTVALTNDGRLGDRDRRILQLLYREMTSTARAGLRNAARLPAAKQRPSRDKH